MAVVNRVDRAIEGGDHIVGGGVDRGTGDSRPWPQCVSAGRYLNEDFNGTVEQTS
jgi:hypothetical protein